MGRSCGGVREGGGMRFMVVVGAGGGQRTRGFGETEGADFGAPF